MTYDKLHIFKVYDVIILMHVYSHETVTTIKIINVSIAPQKVSL